MKTSAYFQFALNLLTPVCCDRAGQQPGTQCMWSTGLPVGTGNIYWLSRKQRCARIRNNKLNLFNNFSYTLVLNLSDSCHMKMYDLFQDDWYILVVVIMQSNATKTNYCCSYNQPSRCLALDYFVVFENYHIMRLNASSWLASCVWRLIGKQVYLMESALNRDNNYGWSCL